MKRLTKLLSVLLIFALAASLCSSAFADGGIQSEYKAIDENGNGGVLILGDSFGAGIGSSENYEEETETVRAGDGWLRWITGAYTGLVAEAVGCTREANSALLDSTGNFWTCVMPGMPVTAVLDLLGVDDGFDDPGYYHSSSTLSFGGKDMVFSDYYQRLLDYFGEYGVSYSDGCELTADGKVGALSDMVRKSSLIVIELGMNDIFARSIFSTVSQLGGSAEVSAEIIEPLMQSMYTELNRFQSSYPLAVKTIRELNPDATIVTVGMTNVAFNITLNEDSVLPIGSALSAITAVMNRQMKSWAAQYGTVYVDISNIDLGGSQYDFTLANMNECVNDCVHPTPEGHAQIARLIVNALNDEFVKKTDVKVDIGHFDRVDYVLLDGKVVTDFTVENNVLTVHGGSVNAKNLTIAVVNGTNLAVSTYQLSYSNGYTAYRIYTTNSVVTTVSKAAAKVTSAVKSLFGKLAK